MNCLNTNLMISFYFKVFTNRRCSCPELLLQKNRHTHEALTTSPTTSTKNDVDTFQASIESKLVGQMCVVLYDDIPYPGVVQNVNDNDVEVKVMHKIGMN